MSTSIDQTGLCGSIRPSSPSALSASDARNVDDRTRLLTDHMGQNGSGAQVRTVQVHIDNVAPFVGSNVHNISIGQVRGGVVNKNVDSTKPSESSINEAIDA